MILHYNTITKNKRGYIDMNKIKIVLIQRNEEVFAELKEYLEKSDNFELCGVASSIDEVIELLKRVTPDVAIVDWVIRGIDGIKVLDYIREYAPKCIALMISEFNNDRIINAAIAHGVSYYFIKPVLPQVVVERIVDMLGIKTEEEKVINEVQVKSRIYNIDETISNMFTTIGIPPHIKGFAYLREGIKMAVETPSIINRVTKELYPKIGEKFATTSSKVERAIRHAIDVCWSKGRADSLRFLFGSRIYIADEHPTNSELIALIADKIIHEKLV